MKKITLLFSFLFVALIGIMAGSGTEVDPYSCSEIIANGDNVAAGTYAVGYIVGGRYDDFDYNSNEYAISIADSDSETDVNNCVQVKLSTSQRPDWHPKNNPSVLGRYVIVSGSGDGYGGYPAFESSVTIAFSTPPAVEGAPTINSVVPTNGTVVEVDSIIVISATVETTDAEGLDTVVFVYGYTPDALADTLPMEQNVNTFSTPFSTDSVTSYYGRIIAVGGNGEVTKSDVIEIVSVDKYKPVFEKTYPSQDTTWTLGDTIPFGVRVSVEIGEIDTVYAELMVGSLPLQHVSGNLYQDTANYESTNEIQVRFAVVANEDTVYTDLITISPECGTYEGPVATPASSITSTSFTANWNEVDGVSEYLLDVYTEEDGMDIAADGTGTSADPYSVSQALLMARSSSEYYFKGYVVGRGNDITFGIPATNDYSILFAESPTETDPSKVLVVKVESADRANWGLSSNPDLYQEAVIAEGYRDGYGDGESIEGVSNFSFATTSIKDYILQEESVSGTNKEVTGLEAGVHYKYTVKYMKYTNCESEMSNVIEVTTSTATALETEVSNFHIYATKGNIVIRAQEQAQATVYEITGRQVATQVVEGEAQIAVKGGIYLVKVNDTITKVAVK